MAKKTASQIYSQAIRYAPRDAQTASLNYKVALQRAQLSALGGKVPGNHPSLLNRLFDVVSRPNYAVAGMFNEVVNRIKENQAHGRGGNIAELPSLLGKGIVGGLEGKNKTRFAEVLANMGMANRFGSRGLAGFGLDVALDPLNIVAPGVEKALPALEAEKAAGTGMRAAQLAKASGAGIESAGEAARVGARAATPGRVTLNLLDRPVAGSEALYKGLSRVSSPVLQSDPAQWISRSFRTAHTFPGRLKDMYRVTKIGGAASYNDFESEFMREIGGKLTKDEGVRVSHALNQGVDLTGQVSSAGLDLGQAQRYWVDLKQGWDMNEIGHGIYRPGQGVDNYVPHKFPSLVEYQSDIAKKFRQQAWAASKAATEGKPAIVPTLADLKTAGLHPHENIVDIVRLRGADHFRDISKADFHRRAIEEFGQTFSGKGASAARAAAEKSGWKQLTRNVSEQLGSPLVLGGAKNVHVPEIVHDALTELNRFYASDKATTQFVRTFDNIQRIWKTGVTTPNPSHHIRNMIGDSYLNWLAGVRSPLDYVRSMRILRKEGTVKVGDMVVDAADLHNLYQIHGGAAGFFNTDLVGGGMLVGTRLENPASTLNRGMELLRHVTAQREDFMRLANFSNAMVEGARQTGAHSWDDLERLAADATKRVRKFNFDYGDLTDFETKVRRFVPFYTFMRKNMPLQLEMMVFHPNLISKVPKGFAAIQQILGTDLSHLPITEIVPSYIKDLAGIRLRGEGKGHNALYMNLGLPISDVSQTFSGSTSEVIRKMLGQTTPALKTLIELATHKSLFSGAPIYQGIGGTLMDQFAPVRMGRQLVTGGSVPHSIIQPGERGPGMGVDIANWFSGLGFKSLTPQAQRSELKRQQDPIQARLRQLRTQRINKALRTGGRRR